MEDLCCNEGLQADCGLEMPVLSSPNPLPSSPSLASNEPGIWKKTLFPELRHPKNFRLRFIPPTVRNDKVIGVCQKSAIEGELALLDLTLVGFFLGRRPSFTFVKAALLKQWKIQGNVEIIQMLQGGYAFRFSDVRDRDNILEGDSYFVGGQPLFLRAWDRNLHSGGILGLRNIPLWVSLPGLLLHLWGEEALSTVCSVLGIPLYSDRNTASKSRLAFARVCIEFLGDKPLLETISIEDEMGLSYEQKVVYDWKPPHCISCGVFGHEEGAVEGKEMEVEKPEVTPAVSFEDGHDAAQQHLLQEVRVMPDTLRRSFHEEMSEGDAEAGWEPVRVKKKRSRYHGAPKMGQTRPGGQPFKGQKMLSSSHWRRVNPSAGQVRKAVSLPKMGEFLKFKFCPSPHAGPLSLSGNNRPEKVLNTPPFEPGESSKSNGVLTPSPTNVGSSAGHTPYPNRLVSLARELRRRTSSMNSSLPGENDSSMPRQPINPTSGPRALEGALRQGKEVLTKPAALDVRGMSETEVEENGDYIKQMHKLQTCPDGHEMEVGSEKTSTGAIQSNTERRHYEGNEGTDPLGQGMAANM